jgi:cytochrome c556
VNRAASDPRAAGARVRVRPRRTPALVLVLACTLLGTVRADEDLDEDLMQSIEDTTKSLSSNLSLHDGRASTADAQDLGEMFGKVQTYFEQRGNAADAVDLARKSRDLSAAIARSVSAADFDGALDTSTTLSRACKSCHRAYKKEKDKDKKGSARDGS